VSETTIALPPIGRPGSSTATALLSESSAASVSVLSVAGASVFSSTTSRDVYCFES
jgi:hypothetical protein